MSFDVRALTVGPPGQPLIEGLTFSVARGERVALVGPSGIGKSTALRALCLLDDPLAGALTLDGRTPDEHGIVRWRRRVVLLGQRPVFFGGSVAEELARPSSYASADGPFDESAARARLAELGLERAWDQPAERLSEGEKQRVALVRALSVAPSVLLLDEPTSALDPAAVEQVERLLAATDAALVLVTHSAPQRERLRARSVDLDALRAREQTRAG